MSEPDDVLPILVPLSPYPDSGLRSVSDVVESGYARGPCVGHDEGADRLAGVSPATLRSLSQTGDRGAMAELARRAISGDEGALRELLHVLYRVGRPYARRLAGSKAGADDVLQEALVKAVRRIHTVKEPGVVLGWFLKVLRSVHLGHNRRERRRGRLAPTSAIDPERDVLPSRDPSPEQECFASELARALDECLSKLTEMQRQAFVLTKIDGLSAEEAGKVLGMTPNNVGQHVHQARKKLLPCLEQRLWDIGYAYELPRRR